MMLLFFIVLCSEALAVKDEDHFTITFGSCNKQHKPQPYWENILSHHPDVWVWLGDVVYADIQHNIFPLLWWPADPARLNACYSQQYNHPNYTYFRQHCPKIIGIWDDHDYGKNDGGAEYEFKEESKNIFLDFLDTPKNASQYSHPGIYSSYTFGSEGKMVKIILLDVRYFSTRDDMLGEEQWVWLEQELIHSTAQINIIGSGSQVLPSDKPLVDRWSEADLNRIYQIITHHKVPGVIFLSGDVHHAEILVNNCSRLDYPIYELTSSGLTHSLYGQVKQLATLMLDWVPLTYRIGSYPDKNYGVIKIDWKEKVLDMEIYSTEGVRVIYHREFINQLRYDPDCIKCGLTDKSCTLNYGWLNWRKMDKLTAKIIVTAVLLLCILLGLYLLFRKRKVAVNYLKKIN